MLVTKDTLHWEEKRYYHLSTNMYKFNNFFYCHCKHRENILEAIVSFRKTLHNADTAVFIAGLPSAQRHTDVIAANIPCRILCSLLSNILS